MNIALRYTNNILWLIIAMCFVSRIPVLTSPNMLLDGDESIVGLMAKHLYDGKAFPLYFYGQRYGLSPVEEFFILPFYATMGIDVYKRQRYAPVPTITAPDGCLKSHWHR